MRTIEEVVLDIKRILNEVERTEEFSGDTSVEIDELVNEIMAISYYPARKDEDWIPCNERLPEEPKENPEFEGHLVELYLVSIKDEKYPFRAFWNGKEFTDGLMEVHPEAWMPLPEPWRGEPDAKEK